LKLLDFHCDTMYRLWETGGDLAQNTYQVDLQNLPWETYGQVFALYCGEEPLSPPQGREKLNALLQTAEKQFQKNASRIHLCRSAEDMELAQKEKKYMAFLSVEGAELLPDTESLDWAWQAGVRIVTLTWNHKNQYGCGAAAGTDGLTQLGRRFVRAIEEKGMIPDVSHLSEKGFWEVAELCQKPFAATHSNAKALCPHIRNLTDEQFLAICRAGGLVGLNLYTPFLKENGRVSPEDVVRHAEHFAALGGLEHLALGCDLDGCDQLPDGIQRLQDLQILYEEFLRHNYKEEWVQGIFFNHLWKFLSQRI
jgi:membrane dipeptidase